MNQAVNLRPILIGGVLLVSVLGCNAMSLGRAKGVVWIGQSLDVSVQVKLDPGDDVASLCASAEIFYSDSRVNGNQIRVESEAGLSRDDATLRIRSARLVDEPVATIYLKVGCKQVSSRRYVLLAEVAGEGGSSFMPVAEPALVAAVTDGKSQPGKRIPVKSASAVDATSVFSANGAVPTSQAVITFPIKASPVARSVLLNKSPAPGRARLKLDPVDFLADRDPVLRSSTVLLTLPAGSALQRADAIELWRAINATPEDIIKDAQRVQGLQAEVTTLKSQNKRTESALVDIKGRLENAQAERYENWLVYGLLAAFLSATGAAVFFWNRGRGGGAPQWWSEEPDAAPKNHENSPLSAPEQAVVSRLQGDGSGVDIDLSTGFPVAVNSGSVGGGKSTDHYGLTPLDRVDFETSLPGTSRAVKVEELFDIQQQADFFISLGQYDQAVATLRNHIEDNIETSALAYLDLLRIFHLQGRQDDYDRVRKEFNHVFNAEVPEFPDFGQQTRGLEEYGSAMSRIMALWPTAKVLEVIEESIFRKPGLGTQAFDLEAYRELLLLYAVAKEIVEGGPPISVDDISGRGWPDYPAIATEPDSVTDQPSFQSTSIQPLPTSPVPSDDISLKSLQVPASPNLGLDIDFSEFEDIPPEFHPPVPAVGTSSSKAPDSQLVDFDLFDLATRAHAATKRIK